MTQTTKHGVIGPEHMPTTTHPYCRTCCTTEHAAGPCPMTTTHEITWDDMLGPIEETHGPFGPYCSQTTDALRAMRKEASEQRRVCLPLDKPGWDRHYKAATAELERRGITCTPYPKHRTTAA